METWPQQCKHFLESLPACQPENHHHSQKPHLIKCPPQPQIPRVAGCQPPPKPLLSLPSPGVQVSHSLTCWWTRWPMCAWWQRGGDWAPRPENSGEPSREKPGASAAHRGAQSSTQSSAHSSTQRIGPTTVLLTGAHRGTHKPVKKQPPEFSFKYWGKPGRNGMLIRYDLR